jgi:tetratricopeptide (TPR) repeat protein
MLKHGITKASYFNLKYQEAIDSYDKAIGINPKYAEAWNNKGVALGSLSKYQEAIESFDKAIEINPNNADAWYNRACGEIRKGKIESGLEDLKKAIEIDTVWIDSAEKDEDFESIRNDERFKRVVKRMPDADSLNVCMFGCYAQTINRQIIQILRAAFISTIRLMGVQQL